jgi:hypothetical protein
MSELRYAQTTTGVVREPGDFVARGMATLLPESIEETALVVEIRSFEDLESDVFAVVGRVNGGWHVLAADFSPGA